MNAPNADLLTGAKVHRPSLQGSVYWMAPEVVKQTAYTSKADIWSLGCLVVEMLTGAHPWANLTQMQAIFRVSSVGSFRPLSRRLTFATPYRSVRRAARLFRTTFRQKRTTFSTRPLRSSTRTVRLRPSSCSTRSFEKETPGRARNRLRRARRSAKAHQRLVVSSRRKTRSSHPFFSPSLATAG